MDKNGKFNSFYDVKFIVFTLELEIVGNSAEYRSPNRMSLSTWSQVNRLEVKVNQPENDRHPLIKSNSRSIQPKT